MNIIFLDESTISLNNDIDYSTFRPFDHFTSFPRTSPDEIISRLSGVDIVMTNKVPITADVINATKLQHIAVVATGYNNIDLSAAEAARISVSNVPGYAKSSVPQHVFALLLNLVTAAHRYDADVRNGEWQRAPTFTLLKYSTAELAGKTIGIIGFGSIGRAVAKIAEAFGMRVLMNRKSGLPAEGYPCSSLESIYEQSDVISLNCPLTVDNRYMIDQEVLRKMKPKALLINTARGPLINQADLADALNNDIIGGAGIDVLDIEPPRQGNPLLGDVKNCIVTPHSAWSTIEARQRLVDEVAKNIKAFVAGDQRNLVRR